MNNRRIANKNNSEGAASIVMVLFILSIVLAIALGSTYITSSELKLSGNATDSVVAFYAAESGVEEAMHAVSQNLEPAGAATTCVPAPASCNPVPPAFAPTPWTNMGPSTRYYINVTGCVCTGSITRIQAIGEYDTTRRSIEISF